MFYESLLGRTAMKLARRTFLHLAAGAAALPAVSRIARAQAYPSRPVGVIVPFAPGGQTDVVARLVAQKLSDRLGKQFFVENAAGGGGDTGGGRGAGGQHRRGPGCASRTGRTFNSVRRWNRLFCQSGALHHHPL